MFKVALVSAVVMVCGFANADVVVIQNPIQGIAIEGPDNLFQIMNPSITVDSSTASLFMQGDVKTGRAACSLLKLGFRDVKSTNTYVPVRERYASFDQDGILSLQNGLGTATIIPIMNQLICVR